MVLLQGLCYVVDITMVFLTFIGIFDFVFHLVELSRGLLLLNLPYRIRYWWSESWLIRKHVCCSIEVQGLSMVDSL
jgi:hypothetical protein